MQGVSCAEGLISSPGKFIVLRILSKVLYIHTVRGIVPAQQRRCPGTVRGQVEVERVGPLLHWYLCRVQRASCSYPLSRRRMRSPRRRYRPIRLSLPTLSDPPLLASRPSIAAIHSCHPYMLYYTHIRRALFASPTRAVSASLSIVPVAH